MICTYEVIVVYKYVFGQFDGVLW